MNFIDHIILKNSGKAHRTLPPPKAVVFQGEIKKNRFNEGINEGLYFFRDSTGNEIDLLMEKARTTLAVEIKSSKKINSGMLSGLRYWKKNNPGGQGLLIYGGEREDKLEEGIHTVNWKKVSDV